VQIGPGAISWVRLAHRPSSSRSTISAVVRRAAATASTFVHTPADGTVFARGYYLLTGLVSWERRVGTFPLPNDGVGHLTEASAGILKVNIRAFPDGGSPVDGVLTIFCHFPDTPGPNDEGFTLDIATFHFTQAGGVTLFHVFR
jgi:hypothetical protein